MLEVSLNGLKEGATLLEFRLGDKYFEALGAGEIERDDVLVRLDVSHRDQYFDLVFHTSGTVQVPCDLCLGDMPQTIDTYNKLVVKFGEGYYEDDDLITIDENKGVIDLSWFIYQFIALAIPSKHVHDDGECNTEMIKLLDEHSATANGEGNEDGNIDSRWNELREIKTIIKE